MAYTVSVSVIFDLPAEEVFDALCRLDDYLLWNSDLVRVSKGGRITENMLIETEANVLGQRVISKLEIVSVMPPISIEMVNNSGAISHRTMYRILPMGPSKTEVVCMLQFTFNSFVLNLARPLVEALAEGRIRANLETLRALLAAD
jgi:hypothetical protein